MNALLRLASFRKNPAPFQDFLAARTVMSLLQKHMEEGVYTQYSYFYRKFFLRGAVVTYIKMEGYPDLQSGIDYCMAQAECESWAFGMIIGDQGKDTNLAMVISSGGKDSSDLINLIQPFDIENGRLRYLDMLGFCRVKSNSEIIDATSEEAARWSRSFKR